MSAVIPLDVYEGILERARSYPTFVLPLSRGMNEYKQPTYEFHYLEWGIFERPPDPRMTLDPFTKILPTPIPPPTPNPPLTTSLFTPLEQYKLHQSFATPYLVLTNYTDLVSTHGVVLLRGEIVPDASNPERMLLTTSDAQLLALGMQKFYVKGKAKDGEDRGLELLRTFHANPELFKWEDVLNVCDLPPIQG